MSASDKCRERSGCDPNRKSLACPDCCDAHQLSFDATGLAQLKAVEAAAKALGVKLAVVEVRGRADAHADSAFQSTTQQGAHALLLLSSPFVGGNTKLLAALAMTHRLPAVTLFPDFARDGGLMAYGPNLMAQFRQQGVMAAKILHGVKPAELPSRRPPSLSSC